MVDRFTHGRSPWNMDIDDVLSVRDQMFDVSLGSITYGGRDWHVTRIAGAGRLYAISSIGPFSLITQNTRKPSLNSDWVLEHPSHELMWIARKKGRAMLGKVMRWVEGNTEIIEVWKFHPERLVKRVERDVRTRSHVRRSTDHQSR